MSIFRNRRAEALEERLIDERHDHNVQMQLTLSSHAQHVAALQGRIEDLIRSHEERIRSIESLHQIIEYEAMRERTELKKAHAEELSRAITENQRLKDDLDRFRLLLTPALQTVELPKEREAREATQEPKEEVEFTGTPFQRMAKRAIAEQEAAAKANPSKRYVKPAEAPLPQGESHGSTSERRVDAPLGGTGKPA